MKKICLFILCLTAVRLTVSSQPKHSGSSLFPSYKGLVMAGYQGWFNAPQDGSGRGWNHYVARGEFAPGNCKIDLWPDVSEYGKTYETPFKLPDGKAAYLFSSYDASTVDVHFKWMKEYGIDGVFMQRFVQDIKRPAGLNHNNTVLKNALSASEKYKSAIAVMYDLSGMHDSDYTILIGDWKYLVDSLNLTNRGNHQTYLYHNGKPLVVIWGIGFSDGRRYGLNAADKLLDFFKNDPVYGGCAVMLGVPTYWRTFGNDTEKDPRLHEVLRRADIIHPWFVGRFNEATYPPFEQLIQDDIAWCKANHLDYVPTLFPGFSWHNMYNPSPQNQIPRNGGSFFWKQVNGAIQNGAEMLYIAMFDEIDEATAIFKISKNPPTGKSNFVHFEDNIPGDYYLYLAGMAGKMLRKELPANTPLPQGHNSNKAQQ